MPQQIIQATSGLVISSHGKKIRVESLDTRASFLCEVKPSVGEIITGDRVIFTPTFEDKGFITELLPRRNLLSRPKALHKNQLIASNIDLMMIVVAPEPFLPETLIARYLVLAKTLGFEAQILLNKCDIQGEALDSLKKHLHLYETLGIKVSVVSAHNHENSLAPLVEQLKDKCSILVGQSGVGKSSLINRLLPDIDLRTQALSSKSLKGCHTTTGTALYHLPFGGDLIDSPGIRQLHLWDLSPSDIELGFWEFEDYWGNCRFRNCKHQNDLGCAIIEAVESGKLSKRRFLQYRTLIESTQNLS